MFETLQPMLDRILSEPLLALALLTILGVIVLSVLSSLLDFAVYALMLLAVLLLGLFAFDVLVPELVEFFGLADEEVLEQVSLVSLLL